MAAHDRHFAVLVSAGALALVRARGDAFAWVAGCDGGRFRRLPDDGGGGSDFGGGPGALVATHLWARVAIVARVGAGNRVAPRRRDAHAQSYWLSRHSGAGGAGPDGVRGQGGSAALADLRL